MIGFFDSGMGGLQTMKYFQKLYPQYKYKFLGDFDNLPYGDKNPNRIKEQTFKNLEILFEKGCKIVILACNTASAFVIRERQTKYPHKKVLSVTIPGIEHCIKNGRTNISVIATENTVKSNIYPNIFKRLGRNNNCIQQIPAPELVPLIENQEIDKYTKEKKIENLIKKYCSLVNKNSNCLILGCTHFPIFQQKREKYLDIEIINPGMQSAIVFGDYLNRHPEIKSKLSIVS